jgi:hypothetical protein
MNKLEQALKQSGVQGLSAKAMLLHAIGYSHVTSGVQGLSAKAMLLHAIGYSPVFF